MTRSNAQAHAAPRLRADRPGARRLVLRQDRRPRAGPRRHRPREATLKDVYEYLRDMSLLIATGGVAYITNVFQKRHGFVEALKEEWRDIIATKSALFAYTQIEQPTTEQYIATFCKLSETIDNMRSVYQNVGETGDLIGLYPFAPLHDMRRALQTLDPRKSINAEPDAEQRNLVRDCHPAVVLRPARDLPGGARPRGAGPPAADLGRAPRQEGGLDRLGSPRAGTPAQAAGSHAHPRCPHRRDAGQALRQGNADRQALAPARRRRGPRWQPPPTAAAPSTRHPGLSAAQSRDPINQRPPS